MPEEKEKLLTRSLERLEFKELLEFLAELARSEPGKKAALALAPLKDLDKIRKDLGLLKEMSGLINAGLKAPLAYFPDLSQSFENAARGSMLSSKELLDILRFLDLADASKKFLKSVQDQFPGLAGIGGRIQNFSELQARLDKTVDEHAEIKNSASPELKSLRTELAALRSQIQKSLERMLGSSSFADIIQDRFYTERQGRFVIPVKSSAASRLSGIVHDASASGATVFIEPMEMVPQNNRLRVIEREIESEIMKILEQLTREIAQAHDQLADCLAALAELDLVQAKAELAGKLAASIPALDEAPSLALYKVRHPLLVLKGKNAVPNDIVLDDKTGVLVISGPNTGGKTVFIKTVGIVALMARAGMAVPAHPDSRIGFFPEVYAEIGDDQSISQDLSSYSAHLLSLIAFMRYAQNGSLVLVDEILGSTDPEEAAALAIAILRELKNRSCTTAVTTHISRLKNFAESEPGFKNASFEFDLDRLTPTYHLRLGVPGPSYGIATAQKLGLKPELVETARNMLEPESKRIMELMSRLDLKQTELDQGLRKLEAEEQSLSLLQKELEQKSSELSAKEKSLKKDLRRKLESELQAMRIRFNQLFERARAEPSKETKAGAAGEMLKIEAEIERQYPEPELGEEIAAQDWQTGDIAWVSKLRVSAEVIDLYLKENEAALAVGSIRLKEKLSGLRRIKAKAGAGLKEETAQEIEPEPAGAAVQAASNTLDLRGKRGEEAEIELIDFLDRSAREGKPAVFIIHGHGTGVLKKMTREYLAESPYVKSFRPGEIGEGGDGVTVAFLEKMAR